uniref:Hyaluronan and proteoglycan link protein 3 n=1 Tax=Hucho hucho TaxID=62062 RepID=A0A4W5KSU0_9TELE
MLSLLRPLLVVWMYLLVSSHAAPRYNNGFFYHDIMNGDGNGESRSYSHKYRENTLCSAVRGWPEYASTKVAETEQRMCSRQHTAWRGIHLYNMCCTVCCSAFRKNSHLLTFSTFCCFVSLAYTQYPIMSKSSYVFKHFTNELKITTISCSVSSVTGTVYFLKQPQKFNFTEAVAACVDDGGHIAKVGQLYAAWRFMGLDLCDAGWLADGSVRYPIAKVHTNCGPSEPGVRHFGFPPQQQKYIVYCYR